LANTAWQRAIVVGASSGMGEALARQLAQQGCQVALVARRESELARITADINQGDAPVLARAYVHDVREYECIPALFQQITHDLGGLDLIIYAAGIMPLIGEDEYAFDKDRLTFETNVLGGIAWLNEAAQRFERAKTGTIVGLSSVAGDRGRRGFPAYCASKAALDTYLEALRNRVGRHGVRVVTIKPGPVDTPMTKDVTKKPMLISADEAARTILAAAGAGRRIAYVPGKWRPIMWILRHIPSAVFQKMNI
jgi:decaprenylphospho-beta-D-erythro-pentofuranosid-2-ulose 2-reductase